LAWACLQSPQNLWDFALFRKKEKTKPKGFAIGLAESLVRVRRPTCHSRDRW